MIIIELTERYLFDIVSGFDGFTLLNPLFQSLREVFVADCAHRPLSRRQVILWCHMLYIMLRVAPPLLTKLHMDVDLGLKEIVDLPPALRREVLRRLMIRLGRLIYLIKWIGVLGEYVLSARTCHILIYPFYL